MKAITIHEPYASLIIMGIKRFETRGWSTNLRGSLAIHAARQEMTQEGKKVAEKYDITPQYGKVLGVVEIINCFKCQSDNLLSSSESRAQWIIGEESEEKEFGWFTVGRFAWQMKVLEKFEIPIPAKGQQRFWTWDKPRSPVMEI